MDSSLCSSSPPPEPVACEVPCSRDCVLSDWTPWSTCSQTCSSKNIEGKQMRTRSILAYNAGEGEPSSSAFRAVPAQPWPFQSRPLLSLAPAFGFHTCLRCAFLSLSQTVCLSVPAIISVGPSPRLTLTFYLPL